MNVNPQIKEEYDEFMKVMQNVTYRHFEFLRTELNKQTKYVKNHRVLAIYGQYNSKKYKTLDNALEDYKPGDILIYFTEVDTHGIFKDINDFHYFLQALSNEMERNNFSCSPSQLILSSENQKIVFCCNDKNATSELSKYAKNCFGGKVDLIENVLEHKIEMVIDGVISKDYNDMRKMYSKLYDHVKAVNYNLAENISINELRTDNGVEYSKVNMRRSFTDMTIEELTKLLATIPSNKLSIGPININGNNNKVVINTVNGNANNIKKDNNEELIKWIMQNKPQQKEFKKDYYAKAKEQTKTQLSFNKFCGLMRDSGFNTTCSSNGTRHWMM